MSQLKTRIIDAIIAREGGYSNNPKDSGGETMYGITVAVARANGWTGAMKDLPREKAFAIYADKYWNAIRLDDVEALSGSIAEELADTAVNSGTYRAAEFLQRSLNALNNQQSHYSDLVVDGNVGSKTVETLRKYFATRRGSVGETVLLRMLNALQGAFLVELCEKRQKDEEFIYGWFLHRVSI